jgi:hypothetical protein
LELNSCNWNAFDPFSTVPNYNIGKSSTSACPSFYLAYNPNTGTNAIMASAAQTLQDSLNISVTLQAYADEESMLDYLVYDTANPNLYGCQAGISFDSVS